MVVVLLLRGHVRNSFENDDLYNFIKKISLIETIDIYIHTWNVYSNNLSWREIKDDDRIIYEEIILNYFKDLKHNIKHIIINNDLKIELVGKKEGYIGNGKMPLIGWKNMWYGNNIMIDYISKKYNSKDIIINTRIDILTNSNIDFYNSDKMLSFIKNSLKVFHTNKYNIKKNIFMYKDAWTGIDNIIFGSLFTMKKIIKYFHYNLDEIIESYEEGNFKFPHEFLVFKENEKLFYTLEE